MKFRTKTLLILTTAFLLNCNGKQNQTEKRIEKIAEVKTDSIVKATASIKEESKSEITRPCDFRILKETDSLLQLNTELDEQDYLKFIVNMRIDCANNVEYSQWNNELIFKMLEKRPKMFVTFLSRFSTKTRSNEKTDFILKELRNPIHDGIELNKILNRLGEITTVDSRLKELVYASINKAIEKNK
ncbi:MAG: hypothetical protein COA50_16975 [Flavobacteriaceae bacterium]|nr:MAG: hypothetical protein COA50_16975 [Flavobacteriaceae bacterium]